MNIQFIFAIAYSTIYIFKKLGQCDVTRYVARLINCFPCQTTFDNRSSGKGNDNLRTSCMEIYSGKNGHVSQNYVISKSKEIESFISFQDITSNPQKKLANISDIKELIIRARCPCSHKEDFKSFVVFPLSIKDGFCLISSFLFSN